MFLLLPIQMTDNKKIKIHDYGCSDYEKILIKQREFFQKIIEEKREKGHPEEEYILIGEHNPVITLGKHADKANILLDKTSLKEKGIKIYEIERGGDVTYHCPEQLVVYPIVDLKNHKLGVKKYVEILEESVIRLLKLYGINGERISGATGVWIRKESGEEKKICAIGVKCSHFCTMHGLALNVNSDLKGFEMINPCGFKDKGVTSMESELGRKLDFETIKKEFSAIFLSLIFPFEEVFDFPE